MLKNRFSFVLISISYLLLSCENGNNAGVMSSNSYSSLYSTHKVNSSTSIPSLFTLGGTYDSMSNHPTAARSCINAALDTNNMQITHSQSTLNFSSSASANAVKNALGVEVSAQVGWGQFSAGASYHYANTSQDDDYTLNLNYIYQYAGQYVFKSGALVEGIDALTPEAKSLVSNGQWIDFRRMCGDEFITQMNAGASVLMKLTLSFNSHAEKNSFDSSMAKAVGLSDVISQIEHNTSGINYHLQVSGMQVGGNPELLNQLFIKYNGQIGANGYPLLDCGSNGNINSNCVEMVNEVINYASSVSDQLSNINAYYLYTPVAETWDKLGIFPGPANPDASILQAMNDLSSQYLDDQASLNFLSHYYPILESANLLSTEMKTSLSQLINNYTHILQLYTDQRNQIMNCYDGYVSIQCPTIRDNIFRQRADFLSDTYLNQLMDYMHNNMYITSLWRMNESADSSGKTICTLMPISDSSKHIFLTDCDGQVSGLLDAGQGTSITHDETMNTITVANFGYNYLSPQLTALYFSYVLSQPLVVDFAMPNSWFGEAKVYLNGSFYDTTKIHLVKQY